MIVPEIPKKNIFIRLLPFFIFSIFCTVFFTKLFSSTEKLPSALIGKIIPDLVLTSLNQEKSFNRLDLIGEGKMSIVNIFASWCSSCVVEHPVLAKFAKKNQAIKVFGLNYKDNPKNAQDFLMKHGNPYNAVMQDRTGRAVINLGVYGVPESFVINEEGRIIHRHIGPITNESLEAIIALMGKMNKKLQ